MLEEAQLELVYHLEECDMAINSTDELLALLYLARFRGVPTSTMDALPKYYQQQGIDPPVPELAVALPKDALQLAEYILTNTNLEDKEQGGIPSHLPLAYASQSRRGNHPGTPELSSK